AGEARMARARLAETGDAAIATARADAEQASRDDDRQRALWDVASLQEWMGRARDAAAQYREIKAGAAAAAWRRRAADRLAAMVEERVAADRSGPPVPSASRWMETAEVAETAEAWEAAAEYHVKLADLAADPAAKLEHQVAAARCLQIAGKPERALELYRAAARSGAGGDRVGEIVRSAGMVLEGMRRYGEALRLYTELMPRDRPAWARLRVAFCRERTGDDADALGEYRELIDRPDGQTLAPDALLGISRILERRKEFEAARAPLQRILDDYAASPRAPEAKVLLASLGPKAAEWEALRQELERMAAKYPRRERRTGE
ncbi:MAG: hypothetical protein AAB368_07385, partial [bacterium]